MKKLKLEFVEWMPDRIDEGILYITMKYHTVVHKCPCGCENNVVTSITPKSWLLTYDGDSISLSPSISNVHLKCRSHYWIKNSEIKFASREQIVEQSKEKPIQKAKKRKKEKKIV